jgi:4-amino-4-deoxy-L-arabinose transferase-like glycosyltransferase
MSAVTPAIPHSVRPTLNDPGPSEWRFMLLVAALFLAFNLPLLGQPFTYRNDAWREADDASITRHFAERGYRLGHPQVYWGGTGPGYVETELPIYNFLVAELYALAGERLWIGRALSLAFMTLAVILFGHLARDTLPDPDWRWALGFFAASPLIVRYATAYMPEAMVVFFYLGAVWFFQRWLDHEWGSDLVLSGACVCVATLIKASGTIVLVLLLPVLAFRRFGPAVLRRPLVWIVTLAVLVAYASWYRHAHALYLLFGNTFGVASGGDTKWGDPSYWLAPGFWVRLARVELHWVLGSVSAGLFLLGLWQAWRRRTVPLIPLGVLATAVYLVLIGRASEKEYSAHYHIFGVPFVALAMGLGAAHLRRARPRALAWLALAVFTLWFGRASALRYLDHYAPGTQRYARLQIETGRLVAARTTPRDLVIVSSGASSTEHGRRKNYEDPMVFFYADRRGWSLARDHHDPAHVDSLRRLGATVFVVRSSSLAETPPLADYLARHARETALPDSLPYRFFRF